MELKTFLINNKRVAISTFIGKNRSEEILEWQQKVFEHFNLVHNYIYVPFEIGYPYGHAINQFVNQTLELVDYYVFMDVDAIPLRKNSIELIIKKIEDGESIWGISQQSTHILKHGSPFHVYAGFSCCAFSKDLYIKLGKPTFSETPRGDIGEENSWRTKELGYNICLSYPNEFHELTDEEMKTTGNARHGWIDNGLKIGLGSSFGNNLVYHSFHTDCHKGTNNLRIPRAAELFIKKAKQAILISEGSEYPEDKEFLDIINNKYKKPRKLELITGCVNTDKIKYSKFLEITLPLNKPLFDNILIVTSPDDKETIKVCLDNGVDYFCTNKFFENGSKFDNNKAVSYALECLKFKDWVVSTSPDIIYPPDFRDKLKLEELDSNKMYGTSRCFINTYKDWLDYKSGKMFYPPERIEGFGCGFCQIFDLNSPKLKNVPLNETLPSNGQAVESDIWFLKRFHPDVRDVGKLDITLIHLGHKDFGGKTRDESDKLIPFFFD